MSRSQIFSIDLNVSLFLFLSFTLLAIFFFNYTSVQIDDYISMREMENLLILSTDSLVTSHGYPEGWNSTNVISIGLADEENVLNYTKLLELNDTPYNLAKTLLTQGLYNFYLNVSEFDNSQIMLYGDYDLSSAGVIIPLKRMCLLDNGTRRPVYLEMVMWR